MLGLIQPLLNRMMLLLVSSFILPEFVQLDIHDGYSEKFLIMMFQFCLKIDSLFSEITVTLQFAKAEFSNGSSEHGIAFFEKLVGTYPSRTDLWSVYIDALTKLGRNTQTRLVRVFSLIRLVRNRWPSFCLMTPLSYSTPSLFHVVMCLYVSS